MSNAVYDIGIIGGGLAGLCTAIQVAKKGHSVILIEKESYPFHKVCGEYISLESWGFLKELGVPLNELSLPIINTLTVSSPNGNSLQHLLPLGGFGISRYKLDNILSKIAIQNGVALIENCKVEDVLYSENEFTITTNQVKVRCKVCCGSFGKRSNLDVKWKRKFITKKNETLNNFIAVKYHAKINFPLNEIALHNFKNGYCGISKIEDDLYCICYLTTAKNLQKNKNSIPQLEKNILQQNIFLQQIFSQASMMYEKPLTIAQISFSPKKQIENHMLLIGDAAGLITPLCGNGMSMAMHASKIAFEKIDYFLQGKLTRTEMEIAYTKEWKKQFSARLRMGRWIQRFFGKEWVTNLFISILKQNSWLVEKLIKRTHGKPF
jgi:flavin-dependent dehydrogenase